MYAEVSESIKHRLRHQPATPTGCQVLESAFYDSDTFVRNLCEKSFSVILNMVVLNKTFNSNTTMLCILLM